VIILAGVTNREDARVDFSQGDVHSPVTFYVNERA
jgi:hypothetical protein